MIDALLLATMLFAQADMAATAPVPPPAVSERQLQKISTEWEQRGRMHRRDAKLLNKEFERAMARLHRLSVGYAAADSTLTEKVTATARDYHAAVARAEIAERFAAFMQQKPDAAAREQWLIQAMTSARGIFGNTQRLQAGLVALAANQAGPRAMSAQWSEVLAAEGGRAGFTAEVATIAAHLASALGDEMKLDRVSAPDLATR